MIERLAEWLGFPLRVGNEHEWDATISALAAFKGVSGAWRRDLMPQERREDWRLVLPCGPVDYLVAGLRRNITAGAGGAPTR